MSSEWKPLMSLHALLAALTSPKLSLPSGFLLHLEPSIPQLVPARLPWEGRLHISLHKPLKSKTPLRAAWSWNIYWLTVLFAKNPSLLCVSSFVRFINCHKHKTPRDVACQWLTLKIAPKHTSEASRILRLDLKLTSPKHKARQQHCCELLRVWVWAPVCTHAGVYVWAWTWPLPFGIMNLTIQYVKRISLALN